MNAIKSIYDWVIKYKIYHLVFWFAYHFTWWIVFKGGFIKVFDQISQPSVFISFFSYIIFQAIGVYFCLYFLIPRYLEKSKYLKYIALVIITIFAMAILILIPSIFWDLFFPVKQKNPGGLYSFFLHNTLPSSIGSMTLGMSIKLTKNWLSSQKKQQVLEKEKLETELKFLKSQFNPHFLFNTINSIFVLINKNTVMATESLAKFSDLLRYQLYECNEHQILLDKELSYLRSFIELEELRQNDNFVITADLPNTSSGNLAVAPFLLMPFIENAFKHISQHNNKPNRIEIKVRLEDNQFMFKISNTVAQNEKTSRDAVTYGGLGLKNVKRRLELLYPNNYTLELNQENDKYIVVLKLNLEEHISPQLKPYQL
ncbi:sensor histidine kinase [Aquimarina algiphila]|uniref:sensor histidine kinase n=1 Tax=Aquimarina algiphila TaxID=2047982 RepID=UPI00232B18F4|nr:histidine kinase [Aquimarina algiphila]